MGVGTAGVLLASRRFHGFNQLTLQFRTFLAISAGTFGSIVYADKASRDFNVRRNPEQQVYQNKQETLEQQVQAAKPAQQKVKEWISTNRYPIIFGSWVASMGIALGLVSRNRYLTGAQKLVQARVYAQGLTVAVLVSSFALEARDAGKGQGRWETVKVLDPNDPTHQHMIEKKIHHERYAGEDQWMDMVAAEEQKMKERDAERQSLQEAQASKEKSDSAKKPDESDKKSDIIKKADRPKKSDDSAPKSDKGESKTKSK